MINTEIKKAINLCINKNVPFIAYILPDGECMTFYSNPSSSNLDKKSCGHIDISFFGKNSSDIVTVFNELDVTQTIKQLSDSCAMIGPEITPWRISTNYMQYCAQVHRIVNGLKRNGGKTVLSRVICRDVECDNWADEISAYFSYYPDTFRYVYYTTETGCWFGASPELLLEYVSENDYFATMALAGTRSIEEDGKVWDEKNVEEHDYVTDYIVNTLAQLGIETTISPAENLKYGKIEHLCHHIKASLPKNGLSYVDVMQHLSPTPALAGYPIENALNDIDDYEVHPRHCYGGFVVVNDKNGVHAYVNLRCVHFDKHGYCIYAGGGLTSKSVDVEEWKETESKVSRLETLCSLIS